MPQDFRDPSLRLVSVVPIIGKFRHYLVPGNRAPGTFPGNKDIRRYLVVVRNDKAKGPCLVIGSHHPGNPMSQYSRHSGLLSSSMLSFQDFHTNRVSVEGSVYFLLRNIEILIKPFYLHESKASGIADKGTHKLGGLPVALHVLAPLRQGKPPFPHQLVQNFFKLLPVRRIHLHKKGNLLFFHGNIIFFFHQPAD